MSILQTKLLDYNEFCYGYFCVYGLFNNRAVQTARSQMSVSKGKKSKAIPVTGREGP
jgi:hypothetical protein